MIKTFLPLFFLLVVINNLKASTTINYDNLTLKELLDIKVYSATKDYIRVEEVPANFLLITKNDIKKLGYKKLIDVLKHQPGFYILDDTDLFSVGTKGSYGSTF